MTPILENDTVLLHPYARGVQGRDTLYYVWRLMEDEGDAQQIFYSQLCADERTRGDLVECVHYFSSTMPVRFLVMPQEKTSEEFMGLVWFDHLGHVGSVGVFYRKAYRGKASQMATQLACEYAYATFGYSRLFGFTPYKAAVRHVRALGWQHVGKLPGFVCIDGKERDLYQMMHTKE